MEIQRQIIGTSLTFDDVLLLPGYSGFARSEVSLETILTPKIKLKAPFVSAPMDTVTESKLAIELGKLGGIGIIHRNLTINDQAKEVKAVKKAGQLVGAAVGSSSGYEERVRALVEAGANVILVDSAHGNSLKVIEAVKYIKKQHKIEVIAGNIATSDGARRLIEAGADSLRVGMGPGAICSTRIISGMGVPQLSAIVETSAVTKQAGIPIIADGGIVYSGDIVKALSAGASAVMMGRMFSATRESVGKIVRLEASHVPSRFQSILNGSKYYDFKEYRGMGSIGAMKKGQEISSEDEYHGKDYQNDTLIAEGVEGLVPCTGSLKSLVKQLSGGIQSGMYYVGAKTIDELSEISQFTQITQASLTESHPHDLFITNPGENYA